ncbi:MAG: hypothetical protein ACYS0D_04645 [Planctomycetota bacterium]|jgi:hypothetical protein
MTSPALFSQRDLLELAALDAFGLLDEYESELYDRSFHHAPAPVQDQIKRLQAEIASDESLLPADKPDRSLRQKVLEAVARTADAESISLQPLARIGRHRYAADAAQPRLRRGGSAQFWRAACFVLAGVSVVMGYFLTEGVRESSKLAEATVLNDGLAVQATLLRTKTLDFLFDESRKVDLRPKDGSKPYRAMMLLNRRSGEAAILMKDLPRADYILQVVLETTGETQRLHRFFSPGDFGSVKVTNLAAKVLASVAYWEITDLQGTVLLTSAA